MAIFNSYVSLPEGNYETTDYTILIKTDYNSMINGIIWLTLIIL